MLNKNSKAVKEMKEAMLNEKPASECTYYEKAFYREADTLSDRLDFVVTSLAEQVADAKWQSLASDTVDEYNEWNRKRIELLNVAWSIRLKREVQEASEHCYKDLVETWGNPQMK
jgi:hypothetical protein